MFKPGITEKVKVTLMLEGRKTHFGGVRTKKVFRSFLGNTITLGCISGKNNCPGKIVYGTGISDEKRSQ